MLCHSNTISTKLLQAFHLFLVLGAMQSLGKGHLPGLREYGEPVWGSVRRIIAIFLFGSVVICVAVAESAHQITYVIACLTKFRRFLASSFATWN